MTRPDATRGFVEGVDWTMEHGRRWIPLLELRERAGEEAATRYARLTPSGARDARMAEILTPVGVARVRHELGEPLTRDEAEALFLAFDRLMEECEAVRLDRDNLRAWCRMPENRAPLSLPAPYRPVATGIDA